MLIQSEKILPVLKKILLSIFVLSLLYLHSHATNIKGKVELDDSWEPVIYLSVINSFDDLNTASYDFLIYQANIDSLGVFEINHLKIQEEERIYRLHICKKGDPVSTIIIGGKDENFCHFIMKNNDSIQLNPNPKLSGFHNSIIQGHEANNCLNELFQLRKNLNSPPDLPSAESRQLLREQILENYTNIADTSSYSIIKLAAMYFISESFSLSNQLHLMEKINAQVLNTDSSSPYYAAFFKELSYIEYQSKTNLRNKLFLISGIIAGLTLLTLIILQVRKKITTSDKNGISNLTMLLSVQEKRVLELLKEGKTNKEISHELHIEVSTVKSHLNKIYSRLGVKSRKEIINSNW